MAISAAGLPIFLQASQVQLQDLIGSFSPGDVLKGRTVEVLPQNQVLLNIRGQNVVAQLPANLSLAKGDVLSLQVTQAEAGGVGAPASLVLKLLAATGAPGSAGAAAPPLQAGPSLAASAQLEQALGAAKLPATALNVSLAQTLARLGAPLDPATLSALSRAAESLLANERGVPAGAGSSPEVEQTLEQGLAQFKLAGALSPTAQDSVYLGQAARGLEAALAGGPPESATPAAAASLRAAIAQVLAQPDASSAAGLNEALENLASGAGNGPSGPVPSGEAMAGASTAVPAGWQPNLGSPNSVDLPSVREALAQWLGPLNQSGGDFSAGELAQSARALASSFAGPEQASTQGLVSAVQAQAPGASASGIQAAGAWVMNQVADYYAGLPAGQGVPGTQAIQAQWSAQGLPVPKADLSLLPPETVGEAVGWLGARGLPPQRPLVESVAAWLNQGQEALPAARQALQSRETLTETSLDARPSLRSAYDSLGRSLDLAGLDPSGADVEAGLNLLATSQGLNLENGLAAPFESLFGSDAGAVAGAGSADPASGRQAGNGGGVRGSLMRLENELGNAVQTAGAAEQASLGGALKTAQDAVRSFNAVPLQAQSAPAFDTVHLPMPVWMNGALGDGSLSVTWRQGRGRELDDKDPVTVAVSLDTESLGPVTVHLRVWKGVAEAGVVAHDADTARFLETGAEGLKQGFSQNTPFALRSVGFSVADPAGAAGPRGLGPQAAPTLGLSLSA